MIKWLKPGENWDDIDRQVLTYGLGPKAFLMGGLPIDRAEELGKSNKFPAEYLDETAKKTEKSNLGKYLLLGLGLTAAAGIVSIAFNKLSKSEQGQQITSQPSTGLQTGEPQIAPQEPSYQRLKEKIFGVPEFKPLKPKFAPDVFVRGDIDINTLDDIPGYFDNDGDGVADYVGKKVSDLKKYDAIYWKGKRIERIDAYKEASAPFIKAGLFKDDVVFESPEVKVEYKEHDTGKIDSVSITINFPDGSDIDIYDDGDGKLDYIHRWS